MRGVTATRQAITKKGICSWHFQSALNLYLAFSADGYSVGANIPPSPFLLAEMYDNRTTLLGLLFSGYTCI